MKRRRHDWQYQSGSARICRHCGQAELLILSSGGWRPNYWGMETDRRPGYHKAKPCHRAQEVQP